MKFTQTTRDLFDQGGYANCWETGKNDADALHHCIGSESNSPYNAAPLNNFNCHQPEGRMQRGLPAIHSFEVRSKYLKKTKQYLEEIGYVKNEDDIKFLNKYKQYYV